jgi:hypothetical protein
MLASEDAITCCSFIFVEIVANVPLYLILVESDKVRDLPCSEYRNRIINLYDMTYGPANLSIQL